MPNPRSQYHIYTHKQFEVSTFGDFILNPLSIGRGLSLRDLLLYDNENGELNADLLIEEYKRKDYTAEQKNKYISLLEKLKRTPKQESQVTNELKNNSGQNITSSTNTDSTQTVNDFLVLSKQGNINVLKNLADIDKYPISSLRTQQRQEIERLPNKTVQQILTKFCLRVERETPYYLFITSSYRPSDSEKYPPHLYGLAIDTNVLLKSDNSFFLKKPKSAVFKDKDDNPSDEKFTAEEREGFTKRWKDTGIITIAEELNIRWGGGFTSTYFDPIHFDLYRTYYDVRGGIKNANLSNVNASTSQVNEVAIDPIEIELRSLPINIGTILNIKIASIDRELLLTENNQVVDLSDYESFFARELFFLLKDPTYKASESVYKIKDTSLGSLLEIYPYLSVWIWSRAASINLEDGKYKHTIFNITPYISSISTSSGENGGAFNIDVAPIQAELIDQKWVISKGSQVANKSTSGDYVSHNFTHYTENDQLKRNRFFFEKNFQNNDIVFIRFERLTVEENRVNLDNLETIDPAKLPNQIFDMIGLVDNTSIATNSGANVSVGISGRDLTKLFIEDGVYFYPFDYLNGGIFANESGSANARLNRFNGQIKNKFQVQNKNIEKTLQFIFNALGSIDICPTDLFSAYQNCVDRITGAQNIDKRTKVYQLSSDDREKINKVNQSIEAKKKRIIDDIIKIQRSYKITSESAQSTYSIIHSFLKQRFAANEIVEKNLLIDSWNELINGKRIENLLPLSLEDKLYRRGRIYTFSGTKYADTKTNLKSIYSRLDQLISLLDRDSIDENPQVITYQIIRKNAPSLQVIEGVDNQQFEFEDMLDQIQQEIDKSVKSIDATSFDSTSTIRIDFTKTTATAFLNQLNSIKQDYQALKLNNTKLFLRVVNPLKKDLTASEMNVFNNIYSLIKEESEFEKNKASGNLSQEPVNGIWQIIKLVVDDSVKNRLIADPSIGNEHGSLINAIRKVCQDPFCEFLTDTYADQFYCIVRKKPFDKESLASFLEGRVIYERFEFSNNPTNVPTTIAADRTGSSRLQSAVAVRENGALGTFTNQSIILDIEEGDLISDNLNFSTEAYSWYRLNLQNLLSGNDANMSFAYLKAVYFNEYADIYGSKPLDISTSYIPYQNVVTKGKKLNTSFFIQQGLFDLKYLIESNAYLPFSRQGTISINGDRRIKKGSFIRLKSTGEIFYVNAVSHSFSIAERSIDRATTLQVSRGMVEKYILGDKPNDPNNISYFNICNLDIPEEVFKPQQSSFSDFNELVLSKWKVNKNIFNFFLKRLQFSKDSKELYANQSSSVIVDRVHPNPIDIVD